LPNKTDVYTRFTETIIGALEQGVRPWHKPWNAEHAARKITPQVREDHAAYIVNWLEGHKNDKKAIFAAA
jgi:antirestriction protein ArdC